jgi:lactoylglutathione lyase
MLRTAMRIEHMGIWVGDLERMKGFYESYFNATAAPKYTNPKKGFCSYFLSFGSGARLEIMQKPGPVPRPGGPEVEMLGYAHLAISVGSEAAVDALAARFEGDGHCVLDVPRRTGDGCYEALLLDPECNRIEITA